ncbi:MAG: transposase [Pseudomonadales bacterium]
MTLPSASTSAYCQARQKLQITDLQGILSHTAQQLDSRSQQVQHPIGRRVVVADGSGLSMPYTALNQQRWPQLVSQKLGFGFPKARLSACFDLRTSALLSHAIGNKKTNELPLFRQQWSTFREGDVFLGDKAYCSYYDLWQLQQRGVDWVLPRFHGRL